MPRAETRSNGAAPSPAARTAPVQQPGRYLLQAGSFSTPGEADRLQANLALRGVESHGLSMLPVYQDMLFKINLKPNIRVVKELPVAALIDALASGQILGAGLDVTEIEPVEATNPLLTMGNVVITPHTASVEPAKKLDNPDNENARPVVASVSKPSRPRFKPTT